MARIGVLSHIRALEIQKSESLLAVSTHIEPLQALASSLHGAFWHLAGNLLQYPASHNWQRGCAR